MINTTIDEIFNGNHNYLEVEAISQIKYSNSGVNKYLLISQNIKLIIKGIKGIKGLSISFLTFLRMQMHYYRN